MICPWMAGCMGKSVPACTVELSREDRGDIFFPHLLLHFKHLIGDLDPGKWQPIIYFNLKKRLGSMITTGWLGAWRNFHFNFFFSLYKRTSADHDVGGILCVCVFHPLLREVWVSWQGSPGMLTRRKLVRGISPRRVKLPRIDRPKQFMGEDKPHMTMMVMMIRSRMDLLGSCMRGANTKTNSNLLNSATGCLDLVTLTNHGAARS